MKQYTRKTIKYYESIADKYAKSDAAVVLTDKIDIFAKLLSGKKILDAACGPGHDTNYLTKKGFDCLGIDLSEKMINIAKHNFKGKYKIMDFLNLKFRDNSFDGIWCSSILVHIQKKDLPKIFKNSWKILKNNGLVGIITAAKQKRVPGNSDTRTYVMYSKKELKDCLINNGFNVLVSKIFFYGGRKRIFIIVKKI